MIHHPHAVDGAPPITLLVPRDPADPWFVAVTNADGVSWRVTPDGCELELTADYLAALVRELMLRLSLAVPVANWATVKAGAVSSMDADLPTVVMPARTATEEPEQEVNR